MDRFTRFKVKLGANIFIGLCIFFLGMNVNREIIQRDEIYKKYLGESYRFSREEKFSLIISNHVSWIEIVYYLFKYTPGFISKESVKDLHLIGFIAQAIDSLFINRTDHNSRHIIVII